MELSIIQFSPFSRCYLLSLQAPNTAILRVINHSQNCLLLRHTDMVIKRMGWVGYVARMGEKRGIYTGFWWGNPRERYRLGDPGIDRKIKIKMDL
jgi:hypothetical protein